MIRTGLASISIATLVACGGGGGGGASTTPAGTGPTTTAPAGDAAKLWAAVMKPGATFVFDDTIEGAEFEQTVTVVEATVAEVQDVEGGKAIVLAWRENESEMEVSNMPEVVVVTGSEVTFYYDLSDFTARSAENALVFPATTEPVQLPGGLYIERAAMMPGTEDDPERCYGVGPEEGAPDCEDVCFAQLCVDPNLGLTGGEGLWWPDYGVYQRKDLR